ncbi:hypothetical protein [Paraliomyxa miuraensis]|uniref:hypothetical protein n=1 Tax=Paraliomyxa miuraensis TaxID=376150 RepID=UPI00225AB00F|nr:hypothetical protein [Paraliomyxa miuraensis]MCX4239509.1 hypothetical protein [Paraliomyxa miuraensis]
MRSHPSHPSHSARRSGWALLLVTTLGFSCGDDSSVVASSGSDSSTTSTDTQGSTGTSTTGVDTTEGVDVTGVSSSSGSDSSSSDDTTGGDAITGRTVNQLVSSGTRASSRKYTVVHTLGQPSSLQSTHVSTHYRVQGGLVGANGSPP